LLNALPDPSKSRLEAISGQPPDFTTLGTDCAFRPRCPFAIEKCAQEPGLIQIGTDHRSACWRAEEVLANSVAVTA
jgi:oligopeptide/dipeptide ABC transporter ATP-binding protein